MSIRISIAVSVTSQSVRLTQNNRRLTSSAYATYMPPSGVPLMAIIAVTLTPVGFTLPLKWIPLQTINTLL